MLSFSACKVPEPLKPGKVKKDVPINAKERARQNINEGRGMSLKGAFERDQLRMNLVLPILYGEPH